MTEPRAREFGLDRPSRYEIRLNGHIDARWADWFDGLTSTTHPDGTTILFAVLADQAALHGLLRKIGDMGMTLVSVNVVETDDPQGTFGGPMVSG